MNTSRKLDRLQDHTDRPGRPKIARARKPLHSPFVRAVIKLGGCMVAIKAAAWGSELAVLVTAEVIARRCL